MAEGGIRQKYCCPFRQSKTSVCPCSHKNWNNGKKNRGCTKYKTIPTDYQTTDFPLTGNACVLSVSMPCVQSVKDTTPALRRLDRNDYGCVTAPARQISIRWPTFPPWRLRWPPFCTALTPTVLPSSFGVPPDLSFPYLFQARGLPRYGFCALEMPEALLIPICLFVGSSFRLFCSSLYYCQSQGVYFWLIGQRILFNKLLTYFCLFAII